MKIGLLGAELFHAERRTNAMEIIVAFRNSANTPTKVPPKFSKTAPLQFTACSKDSSNTLRGVDRQMVTDTVATRAASIFTL